VEPGLITGRLVLRRVTPADVDNLLALGTGAPGVHRARRPRDRRHHDDRQHTVPGRAGESWAAVRTVHLTWDEPLIGNEHGDVEYRLSREDWIGQAP